MRLDSSKPSDVHEAPIGVEIQHQTSDGQRQSSTNREAGAVTDLVQNVGTMSKNDLARTANQLADSPLDLTTMASRLASSGGDKDQLERTSKLINRATALRADMPCAYHY